MRIPANVAPVSRSETRRDAKREAILSGAKAIFLGAGFERASMDAVAARAGVSKMTVYRHYGSKESLFAGVIAKLCDQIIEDDFEQIFERPPREALAVFARKMIEITFARETVELHRIVVAESLRFPKLGQLFYRSGPEPCIAALQRYFARNRHGREFNVRDPRRTAEEFLELLRGYAHLRVILGIERYPSRQEVKLRIDSAIRHVLNA